MLKKDRLRGHRPDNTPPLETAPRLQDSIRHYKEAGISNTATAPEVYDDLPNQPQRSMDIDVGKQMFNDPFMLAESLSDDIARADAVRRKAAEDAAAGEKGDEASE